MFLTVFAILVIGNAYSAVEKDKAPAFDGPNHSMSAYYPHTSFSMEGGIEWLYMKSTLTPTFTSSLGLKSIIADQAFNPVAYFSKPIEKSIKPGYDSGISVFVRLSTPTSNNLRLQYSYLQNKGSGTLNAFNTFEISIPGPPQDYYIQTDNNHDKGHSYVHTHIADCLIERDLKLSSDFFLRLAGGLSYLDIRSYFQFSDDDELITRQALIEPLTGSLNTQLFSKQHYSAWGLGPKGEIQLSYLLFPSTWRHMLVGSLNTQFALLFSKEWGKGKYRSNTLTGTLDVNTFEFNYTRLIDDREWANKPKFEVIPNVNVSFGLDYSYLFENNVRIDLGAGYRLVSFWDLDDAYKGRLYQGTGSELTMETLNDDYLIYSGPYVKAAIAF
ncbi:MAG: hypothetical protein KDK63_01895 [Chlamydiia bacterium]|nr:hypothetical protein [Chlamydiia bacterium]